MERENGKSGPLSKLWSSHHVACSIAVARSTDCSLHKVAPPTTVHYCSGFARPSSSLLLWWLNLQHFSCHCQLSLIYNVLHLLLLLLVCDFLKPCRLCFRLRLSASLAPSPNVPYQQERQDYESNDPALLMSIRADSFTSETTHR